MTDLPRKLRLSDREDLGDARLVLDTAAHNVRAAIIGEDPLQTLDSAIAMAEQALSTLRRVRANLGGNP